MRFIVLSVIALLPACAPEPPRLAPVPTSSFAAAAAPPPEPVIERAPTPYTAAQIRAASPAGRRIVFRVQEPGKPDVKRVIEFVRSDESGADLRITSTDPEGNVLHKSESRSTWEELRSHAEFPKANVEIKHRTISIPLGTVSCVVYKVTEGEGPTAEVVTYYFAENMPGPPVFYFIEKGGTRTQSSTMESSTTN